MGNCIIGFSKLRSVAQKINDGKRTRSAGDTRKETTAAPDTPAEKQAEAANSEPSIKQSPVKQSVKSAPNFKAPKQGAVKKVTTLVKQTAKSAPTRKMTTPVKKATTVTPAKPAGKPTPSSGGVKKAGIAKVTTTAKSPFVAVKTVSQINNAASTTQKAAPKTVTQTTAATKTAATVNKTTNAACKVTAALKTTAENVTTTAKIAENTTPDAKTTTNEKSPAAKTNPATKAAAENNTSAAKATPEKVTEVEKTTEEPVASSEKGTPDVNQVEKLDEDKKEIKEKTKASVEKLEPVPEITPEISQTMAEELEQIMIKVWKELPDEASTPADRAAVEIFRSDAGDDLRDVFEQNLKQRLLNIHDRLKMRVSLDTDLPKKWMNQFARKFAVKRVQCAAAGDSKRLFIAELDNFHDFDRLYAANRTKMGGVRVTLSPVYDFTEEPEALLEAEYRKYKLTRSRKDAGDDPESLDENDDESMDAEFDFASLMEEGIVLDECVGSDNEE